MPSPHRQFSGIPELLASVGQFIQNRKLLYDLCLTSKTFHVVFIPYLYANVLFDDRNEYILVESLGELLQNEAWKYTNSLDFNLDTPQDDPSIKLNLCKRYNEGVEALLRRMPRLTGFS